MKTLIGAWLLLFFLLEQTAAADPDQGRTLEQLVTARGFQLQTHSVVTADGYILKVHRVVPHDYNPSTYSSQRKPVIAFHGLMADSSIFFMNSPCQPATLANCRNNFGFRMLLEGEYDLWFPNARGNGVSTGHMQYNSESAFDNRFWRFSWEDIGAEDLPAVIQFVRTFTGHQTVGYIGYSQAGGAALAMLTLKPEQAQYISPFIAWSPMTYLANAPTPLKDSLILLSPALEAAAGKFIFTQQWLKDALTTFCSPILTGGELLPQVCQELLEAVYGESRGTNVTRIPVYTSYLTAPVSNWQVAHYGQLFKSGRFARYDYGLAGNLLKYGSFSPPDYRLGQIPKNLPLIIFNGLSDSLVTVPNSQLLVGTLVSMGMQKVTAHPVAANWNHLDYVAASTAAANVYDPTVAYLDQYTVWDGPARIGLKAENATLKN